MIRAFQETSWIVTDFRSGDKPLSSLSIIKLFYGYMEQVKRLNQISSITRARVGYRHRYS